MELTRGASGTYRVALLALFLAAAGSVPALLDRPENLRDLIQLPWWPLALLFAVTDSCVVKVRARQGNHAISLSEIPMVIGLFLAAPSSLLLARLAGGVAGYAGCHRQAPVTAAFNSALGLAGTAMAQLVFILVLGGSSPLSVRGVLAAMLAAGSSGLVEAVSLIGLRSFVEDRPDAREMLRTVLASVPAPACVSLPGVALVLAISHGQAALPVAAVGALGLIGYHAYGTLSARHASLERLYRLSDALAEAPGSADVVQSVLHQSMDLMHARYAELILQGLEQGTQLYSIRAGEPVYGPVEAGAQHLTRPFPVTGTLIARGGSDPDHEFLTVRNVPSAVVVPLKIDGPIAGHLLVGDRPIEEGAFKAGHVRLLETVANHASLALRNGQLIERLHFEARHDELTGLPNRLDFRHQLDAAALRAELGEPCAVMVLDFNGFKAINDSLGHLAGDELLRVLGGRFENAVRGQATVARLGGDEFAVLMPNCPDVPSAQALAAAILATMEEQVPIGVNRLRVGGSLGIALAPEHGTSGTELLRKADLAMYAAKAGAGGRRLYTPEMAAGSADVLTLATDLREAVRDAQITTVFHPLIDMATGAVHSLEVLARWTHPALGEIPPEEFFAAAERSGQVGALSELVLDQALAVCRSWLDHGLSLRMAVNLAPRWLADPSLPERIGAALGRHQVPADLLCLEITERSVIAEPQRATEVLNRLRATGVHLSVDDFGTGHSSLTHLSRLPIDQLKIDRTFTERLYDSGRDRAIVQSIIDLGRNLGIEVVAEGVTGPGTRRALQEMGCTLGQGFLFARPMTSAQLGPMLHTAGVAGWPGRLDQTLAVSLGLVVSADENGADTLGGWPHQTPVPPS